MSLFNNKDDKVKNRINYLEKRLAEIVEEAKHVSEKKKMLLRVGYRLLLEEKQKLKKTAQNL